MQKSFQFIVNDKAFIIPLFDKLMNISSNIREELIFSQQHQYHVQSKIRTEVFEDFIKYLTTNEIPNLSISNINEYDDLSSEFETLLDEVEEKKNELGEFLINIKGLQREIQEDKSQFEESIAIKLDEYIDKYGAELMKSSINSLFNIFNHPRRKLSKYDEAYEIIKNHFEQTNDLSIFILLDTLDGTKMTRSNIEESYSLSSERGGHMPKIELSYFSNVLNQQEKQQEKIIELEKKEIEMEKEIKKLSQKQGKIIELEKKEIKMEEEIKKLSQKQEKIIELEKKEIEMEEEIKKFSQKQEELVGKIDELTKIIEKNHNKYEEQIKKYEKEKEKLYQIVLQQEEKIKRIDISSDKKNCEPFTALISKESPGIINQLKNKEKSPFDRLFIVSQSSVDIYNVINPDTNDFFELIGIGTFIEFEFEESITITGMIIFTYTSHFPKSFDIEINGQKIKSINDSSNLNGSNRNIAIAIDPIQCNKFRLVNTGPNWDKNSNCIIFKRIELLSNEAQYSKGVFSTLIYKSENHDPHKCPVIISSTNFDFNTFYLVNTIHNICTCDIANSWFQIEFLFGAVILNGFRLIRSETGKMKSYKIICSNDANKLIEEWTTLCEIDEKSENEHQIDDIYEFPQPSSPVKFVRIIQIGSNWSDNLFLKFYHFDLFGKYM